jgi:AraC-like DNA-binding protein
MLRAVRNQAPNALTSHLAERGPQSQLHNRQASETRVSITAVRALVESVDTAGVSSARFFAEADLTAGQLQDGSADLSLAQYRRVLRAALVTSGNPALGLHMGERASVGRFGVVGYLAEQSSCLREAFELGNTYLAVLTDGPRLEVVEEGDLATLRFTMIAEGLPEVQLITEFACAMLLRLVRQFVGDDALVRRAYFAYPAPAHLAEYTRVFGGREQFLHSFSGVEIERSWLDRIRTHTSPELLRVLLVQAELLLAKGDRDAPPIQRVKRWLSSHSLHTRPTLDTVARGLGVSPRSLRRQLASERVSFSDLLENARAARAKELLGDTQCSVQDAAYALGFEAPAAFSRAFRRWTGLTPRAYRGRRPA